MSTNEDKRYDPLSMKSLSLLFADYVHAAESYWEDGRAPEFNYGLDREALINEVKRLEAFVMEHKPTTTP